MEVRQTQAGRRCRRRHQLLVVLLELVLGRRRNRRRRWWGRPERPIGHGVQTDGAQINGWQLMRR